MKEFHRTPRFKKSAKKLPASQKKKLAKQLRLLGEDLRHPSVGAKKMVNQKDIWEARVDRSYRFTFKMTGNKIILRVVGTHAIYRKP